jgi:hypothetical protein
MLFDVYVFVPLVLEVKRRLLIWIFCVCHCFIPPDKCPFTYLARSRVFFCSNEKIDLA